MKECIQNINTAGGVFSFKFFLNEWLCISWHGYLCRSAPLYNAPLIHMFLELARKTETCFGMSCLRINEQLEHSL